MSIGGLITLRGSAQIHLRKAATEEQEAPGQIGFVQSPFHHLKLLREGTLNIIGPHSGQEEMLIFDPTPEFRVSPPI